MSGKYLNTLYGRISLSILSCVFALILVGGFLFLRGLKLYQGEVAQTLHQDLARYVVNNALVFNDDGLDVAAAKARFHDLMILGPSLEFYLLGVNGEVLAYSTDPKYIQREKIELKPVKQFLSDSSVSYPLLGQDPKTTAKEKVFSAAPIIHDKKLVGYLYVILSGTQYEGVADMVLSSKMIRWSAWVFVGGGLVSLLLTLYLAGWITRPLRLLTEQIQAIRPDDLNRDINTGQVSEAWPNLYDDAVAASTSNDNVEASSLAKNWLDGRWRESSSSEVKILGDAFAELLEQLKQQHKSVLLMDQSRRELIAHVSHDLRTPLASLQGYLETWELNRARLTEEESEHYIAVAKNNAHTLAKLIEQLFELAQLDGNSEALAAEPLSMAELVQDVLQKFALQAEQKNIRLEVQPKDSTFQVLGDVEKLDRVITNLVENALRHTKAGDGITVNLVRQANSVSVKVMDTGVGIPADDLDKIFEPHFKAGNTIRDNIAHGGLGLTITRKLLALHRSEISVSNLSGAGACFEFSLPCP